MDTVKFKYYEISYRNRESRILVPENISRFWAVREIFLKDFYPEITINGDREGIEALRDACAALSLEGCMAAYFPCRGTGERFLQEWLKEPQEEQEEMRARNFPLDLVLMNPNSIKISDWKKIRRRISKMEAGEWKHTFREEFIDMRASEKYLYRCDVRRTMRFDTVFYIIPEYECPECVSEIEEFLQDPPGNWGNLPAWRPLYQFEPHGDATELYLWEDGALKDYFGESVDRLRNL